MSQKTLFEVQFFDKMGKNFAVKSQQWLLHTRKNFVKIASFLFYNRKNSWHKRQKALKYKYNEGYNHD